MTSYPEEITTITSKGKKEARILVEKGTYLRYTYKDAETGKLVKQGKETILLKNQQGKTEQLFVIPMKGNKNLLIKTKNPKEKKVFDEKSKKISSL